MKIIDRQSARRGAGIPRLSARIRVCTTHVAAGRKTILILWTKRLACSS